MKFQMLFAPERHGDSLKGGGHPADEKLTEATEIREMTGHSVEGHAKTPGIDKGVKPGSDPDPEHSGSESSDPIRPRTGPDSPQAGS